MNRPTIFLSGVSHELGSFRDAVESEVQKKGCFPENQPSFAPDYRTVGEMLRRKLHDADAVIHIVGFRFGAEPSQRPAEAPRRSYTQIEFDIARQLKKPVYVFLAADPSVRDDPKPDEQPEDLEATALQLAHRDAVRETNHLYYFFRDKAELCRLAAEIPPVQAADFQADISRIIKYAPEELIGRDEELELLDEAWGQVRQAESLRPRVLIFVALGGEGKTSLVAKWAAGLAFQNWPGCDAAFAWSFYSQGTREQMAASSDIFLKEALTFFGDPEMAGSAQGAFDKGRRLAQLVGECRALLILDGLEPLQYAPNSPTPGELKDQGVAALLKALAADSRGLCVVTTRYTIPDLRAHWQTNAPVHDLLRLSTAAGVQLLRTIGVRIGSQADFEELVEDMDGHALTLQILGQFLVRAHRGDVRRRDRIDFDKANARIQGGHAFRAMDAYVKWLEDGSEESRRELAMLKLLGLFARPATADCVDALRKAPAIASLTEALVGLAEEDWEFSLTSLRDAKLVTVNRDEGSGELVSLDAHPLLREYFGTRVRLQQREAWRAAHGRLFEHLCATTPDKPEATLEDLQPLYQAVAHGCQAGLQLKACDEVYSGRILRRQENYSTFKLGAIGSDLGAIACFFEALWDRVSPAIPETAQAWLLNEAAFSLRALGRLTEALNPMRVSGEMDAEKKRWQGAAASYGNLSELELTLGEVAGAVGDAERSVTYADRSGDSFERLSKRTAHADALHQAGRRAEAEVRFREAEQMQAEHEPTYPLLYSISGFRYCALLLTEAERAAWQRMLGSARVSSAGLSVPAKVEFPDSSATVQRPFTSARRDEVDPDGGEGANARDACASQIRSCLAVSQRAAQTLKWEEGMRGAPLLDFALHHLSRGRAALYAAILEGKAGRLQYTDERLSPMPRGVGNTPRLVAARLELDAAVAGLRHAGQMDEMPGGLLTRAWLRSLTGPRTGPESAQSDLDEAWEIAERGPMRLFLADIHLHRARLFGPPSPDGQAPKYPWTSPEADLTEARTLIVKHGYGRRMGELEEAEAAAARW